MKKSYKSLNANSKPRKKDAIRDLHASRVGIFSSHWYSNISWKSLKKLVCDQKLCVWPKNEKSFPNFSSRNRFIIRKATTTENTFTERKKNKIKEIEGIGIDQAFLCVHYFLRFIDSHSFLFTATLRTVLPWEKFVGLWMILKKREKGNET